MITELKVGDVYVGLGDNPWEVRILKIDPEGVVSYYLFTTRYHHTYDDRRLPSVLVGLLNTYGFTLKSSIKCLHKNTKQIQLFTSYLNVCRDCGKDL